MEQTSVYFNKPEVYPRQLWLEFSNSVS